MSSLPEVTVVISGFQVGIYDHKYSSVMIEALKNGKYEGEERVIVPRFIQPGDRVLEIGTAIGVLTMLIASIVGCENIKTFDANPYLLDDAQVNFHINKMNISAQTGILFNSSSYTPGDVNFYVHKNFWASSLREDANALDVVKSPKLCLEHEIDGFGADTLVVDIEGGEVELFLGSRLNKINKVMIEVHPQYAGQHEVIETIRYIQKRGFSIDYANSWGGIVCLYRGF